LFLLRGFVLSLFLPLRLIPEQWSISVHRKELFAFKISYSIPASPIVSCFFWQRLQEKQGLTNISLQRIENKIVTAILPAIASYFKINFLAYLLRKLKMRSDYCFLSNY
jgi:hypothetical protein